MIRIVLGVIVGYAVWTALWLGGNSVFLRAAADSVESGEDFTASGPLVGAIALSLVCSIAAGFAAAEIAKQRANVAAFAMGLLLLLTGIGVQAGVWKLMPVWYHLTFLVLIVPACMLGGRLIRRSRDASDGGAESHVIASGETPH